MEKLLLKPEEAAALICVGRSKFYALLAGGVLPTVRIGRSVRVPAEALREWITSQTESPTGSQGTKGEPSRA